MRGSLQHVNRRYDYIIRNRLVAGRWYLLVLKDFPKNALDIKDLADD